MRHFTLIVALLAVMTVNAQYSGPGFYRVHNVGSDSYICIKGTHFEKTTRPDAFWPCAVMQNDLEQVITDPGSIIYIPDTVQVGLYSQGVDTYSLTGLRLDVWQSPTLLEGKPTYVAHTLYNGFNCYFRDYGNGMTAGSLNTSKKPEGQWWIEPINETSIDSSFFAVKPISNKFIDANGWYWTTLCCDFPIYIPEGSGVEGAYTITDITMGSDSLYYAEPVKVYGQGETVPAATPVLFKCASPVAKGNKLVPMGDIANHRSMPIKNDLLMGNYFSVFSNYGDFIDYTIKKDYIPEQATLATMQYLALAINDEGKLTFQPQQEGTYMDANTAWLYVGDIDAKGLTEVFLGTPPVNEPEPNDPEPAVGDVNNDGAVDVNDITSLINMLLVLSDTDDIPEYMDIDGDGAVDVNDVTELISIVLNQQ